jgi:hypothetical protein
MKINANSKFTVVLIADDSRTGWKKGKKLYPKGVYWQGKNLIAVGDVKENHTIRVSLPADIVDVEITG